jgi:hypothetical protein
MVVWYVLGADPGATVPELFFNKMLAEMYAKEMFPHEKPDQRYARVYFRRVFEEIDMDDPPKD